ncbi:InlB B-repeat-containing protein [Anoxybacterium hadale]|uniref:InlB B-repeat-containing protein n=1 Tax=Anoxybacterium hadale TaxID=3408580 RepID=UPI003AFFB104
MKKRILSILLVVCMVVSLLPCFAVTAIAAGEATLLVNTSAVDDSAARGTGARYKTLAGAVAKAVSGDTIKLETDCVIDATVVIEGVTLTFDLNDKLITCSVDNSHYTNYAINVGSGGTLTVTDTANGSGKIQYPSPIAVTSNGTVNVAKGTIEAISEGYGPAIQCNNSAGTVNVSGGKVILDNGGYEGYGAINSFGTVNVSGGDVVGTGATPAIKSVGTANVSGGYINSLNSLSGSTANITGGNIGVFRIISGGTANVTGGTINTIYNDGTLQNLNSQSLSLYIFTGGDPNVAVTSISVTPALSYTYGLNDVKTDSEGKIYAWLPAGITNASVTAGGKTMTIDFRIRGEEITGLILPYPGGYGQMFDFQGNGYSGRVTWSPSATPFLPGTVYTGTFILTAVDSYTFTGMTGVFTVSGATSVTASDNTGKTLKLTVVFPETPSPQPVTVTVKKDGTVWAGHGKSLALYKDGISTYTLNSSGYNASVLPGTYDIYEGTADTGVDITVSKGGANSATVNYYSVTFKSQDGSTTLNTQTVLSGKNAVYGGTTPSKAADAQYSYAFSKWVATVNGSDEAALNNITSAHTVFACFTPTLRSYTVTWKKDSSTTIDTTTVDYGLTPFHVAPTKTGFSFAGWTPALGSVTGDAIYTASWTADPYSISYVLNGGTVAAPNPDNYTIENTVIILNNPTRTGYSFVGWSGTDLTGAANQTVTIPAGSNGALSYTANWKADAPPAPQASIVTARTDKSITIAVENGYEYSLDGMIWHSGTGSYTFTELTAAQPYSLFCRKAEVTDLDSASAASDASDALAVITKNAAPAAPSFTFESITANSVTISTVAGGEYSKDGGVTWQDSSLFTGLFDATKYHFAVRMKENDTTVASAASAITDQYTAAAIPSTGEGYTINYSTGTIGITSGYEVSTSIDFSTLFANGDSFTPGITYYVRKAKDTGTTPDTPASEAVIFTVSAKPDAPSDGAYSYDYTNEQILFGDDYEVYTATSGGNAVTSDSTAITPGSILYIRVKSTDSAPASDWTMITVPARPATTGLSISTSRTDTTITVTEIPGAEYSNDGGTTWQSSNVFTGLNADTDYSITVRYAADDAFASDALTSVTVRTKASAGGAPSAPSVSTQTDHAITIDTVEGYQYAITTSDTAPTIWGAAETTTGTKTFSSLSAATRYYIWVRAAETDTATPSSASRISVYTTASVPSDEGYTIDYIAETINYDDGIYEVTADTVALPLTMIEDGDSITDNISDYGDAVQTIYVRVKAVEDGAPAGAWVEVPLPARPETPSASASNETADNKNDGRISGVTEAMEWKADGGAYTAVTADQASNGITGLSDGTYYVRSMAVSGIRFKSAEQKITIAAGHTITVTFHSQSGSEVEPITGKAYGDRIAAPVDPIRSGFYFAGWYKDVSCTNPWTFTLDALTEDITLYAKWSSIPAYTVTGRIVDETSAAVVGATVRMMQGATQFGITGVTDEHGDFTIDKVPTGIYNLVITKGAKTSIIKVEVSSGNVAVGNAALPSGNANSILVVQGSGTPNVVVGELEREAYTQLAGSGNPLADKVDITLTVEKKDADVAANGSEVTSAAAAAGKQVGMILAIDVNKKVNGTDDPTYNQTSGLIEINIPLPAEMQGKATYAIYRYHGSGVDTITETPNGTLERIAIDRSNWIITLYANKFSTYAIGYTNHSSGGGGGTASPGTKAAAIESQETVALPYYVVNGKEIFIGFAKDADGTMKYIAPAGVTVLFRKNPKDFRDIAGHWAKDNIDFVTERELFLGTGDDKFSPQSGMTRAMFATVIGRLYERSYGELLKKDDYSFADVDSNAYYRAYIDWASENNIITGIGSGLFKPDQEITRQEMAAILYRFAEFLRVLPSGLEKTQLHYPDAAGISFWATEAAGYCQQTGIITGRSGGDFVPQGTATRAEVAAILQRFIESSVN